MSDSPNPNTFTQGRLGPIFAKTALPIIFVMGMNGLLTVVDAIFLGHYVGPSALAAVTLIFPLFMMTVALATLVSNGMSSVLARDLGASDMKAAERTFAGAHGLAVLLGLVLILCYLWGGDRITTMLASGAGEIAEMSRTYLAITAFASPLAFTLAVQSDALRNEGHVAFMAAMSLLVSLSNIGFNFILIAILDLGVAGSALGTALAQLLALSLILLFRQSEHATLRTRNLIQSSWVQRWPEILALGAPQSLNFIGIALGATAVIAALQMIAPPDYETIVTAYGVNTRVLTFVFLPLLGLTHAMQSIVGNNYGAQAWDRSDASLRIGIGVAFVYCTSAQLLLSALAPYIAPLFVSDPSVIDAFTRILRLNILMLWLAGPLIMIATYFQAIGDAGRAAILGLTKPYAFALPFTFGLPLVWGETGIWLAGPASEICAAFLTLVVLLQSARKLRMRLGLYMSTI